MIQVQNQMPESIAVAREQRYKKFINTAREYNKKGDQFRTALCLQVIQNEKLYLETKYKNVYELGIAELGVTKVTISNYINVAKKFLNSSNGYSIFASEKGDYNYSQLLELKKLSVEEARELINSGTISVGSTTKEIKQAVTAYKAQIKDDAKKAKEDSMKPLTDAYEEFHKAFNELHELVTDEHGHELMQRIMDSVVLLYNSNDRLWG